MEFALIRPLVHLLPPETAHRLGIMALSNGLITASPAVRHPSLEVTAFGLSFPNPLGLAAGFDKNAEAVDALLAQGFGFVEAGTVTPRPQSGNPRPRIFRLAQDRAVINRLGFNNDGLIVFLDRFSRRDTSRGIAGVNIGRNKETPDAVADYTSSLKAVHALADYITVNISSPNTPDLRAMQQHDVLAQLLAALQETRAACEKQHGRCVPLLLKVAPDLGMQEKKDIASLVLAHGVDGLIISNTTIARPPSLKNRHMREQGGLSGCPLFAPSTNMLKEFYRLTEGRIPLVGVGGVASAQDAYAKIRAGASLVQLYTALVYQGFGLVREINAGLAQLLAQDGYSHVSQAVGKDA